MLCMPKGNKMNESIYFCRRWIYTRAIKLKVKIKYYTIRRQEYLLPQWWWWRRWQCWQYRRHEIRFVYCASTSDDIVFAVDHKKNKALCGDGDGDRDSRSSRVYPRNRTQDNHQSWCIHIVVIHSPVVLVSTINK